MTYPYQIVIDDIVKSIYVFQSHLQFILSQGTSSISYMLGNPWYILITLVSITTITIITLLIVAFIGISTQGHPRSSSLGHTTNLEKYQSRVRETLSESIATFIQGGIDTESIELFSTPHVKNMKIVLHCLSKVSSKASLYRQSNTYTSIREFLDTQKDIDISNADEIQESIKSLLYDGPSSSVGSATQTEISIDWDFIEHLNSDKYRNEIYTILRRMEIENPYAYMSETYANKFMFLCRIQGKTLNQILHIENASEKYIHNTPAKSIVYEQNMYKDTKKKAKEVIQLVEKELNRYELKERYDEYKQEKNNNSLNNHRSDHIKSHQNLFETIQKFIEHCNDIIRLSKFNSNKVSEWIASFSYWTERLQYSYFYNPQKGYWEQLLRNELQTHLSKTKQTIFMTLHWLTNKNTIQNAVCSYLYYTYSPSSQEEKDEKLQRIGKATAACAHFHMYLLEIENVMKYRKWRIIDKNNVHKYILDDFIMKYGVNYFLYEKSWIDTIKPTATSMIDDFQKGSQIWNMIYSFIQDPRNIIPYWNQVKTIDSGEEDSSTPKTLIPSAEKLFSSRSKIQSCKQNEATGKNTTLIEKYAGHYFHDIYNKNSFQIQDEIDSFSNARDICIESNIPYYATNGEKTYAVSKLKDNPSNENDTHGNTTYAVFRTPRNKPIKEIENVKKIKKRNDDNGLDALYTVNEPNIDLTYDEASTFWFDNDIVIQREKPNSGKFENKADSKNKISKIRYEYTVLKRTKEYFTRVYPQFYIEKIHNYSIRSKTLHASVQFRDARGIPDNEALKNSLSDNDKSPGKGDITIKVSFSGQTTSQIVIESLHDTNNTIDEWIQEERTQLSQTIENWAKNAIGNEIKVEKFGYRYVSTKEIQLDAFIKVFEINPAWDDNWNDIPNVINWAYIEGNDKETRFKMSKKKVSKYTTSTQQGRFGGGVIKEKNPLWNDQYETIDWSQFSGISFDGKTLRTKQHDTPKWILDRTEKRNFTINVNGNLEFSIQKAGQNGSGDISQYDDEQIVEGFIMKIINSVINTILKPFTAVAKFFRDMVMKIVDVFIYLVNQSADGIQTIFISPIKAFRKFFRFLWKGFKIVLDGIISVINQVFGKISKFLNTIYKLFDLLMKNLNKPIRMLQIVLGSLLWMFLYVMTFILSLQIRLGEVSVSIATLYISPVIYIIRLIWACFMTFLYIVFAYWITLLGLTSYIIDVLAGDGVFTRYFYYIFLACENEPDFILYQPYAHKNNMFEKGIFCLRPCKKGYATKESMWCYKGKDDARYCPQINIIRTTRNSTDDFLLTVNQNRTRNCDSLYNPQSLVLCQNTPSQLPSITHNACIASHCEKGRWQPFCTKMKKKSRLEITNTLHSNIDMDFKLYVILCIIAIAFIIISHNTIMSNTRPVEN